MFKKIKSFISSGLLITAVILAFVSVTPQTSFAKCVHTYVKVINPDGTIWIYEYDEAGNLIDVYPSLD